MGVRVLCAVCAGVGAGGCSRWSSAAARHTYRYVILGTGRDGWSGECHSAPLDCEARHLSLGRETPGTSRTVDAFSQHVAVAAGVCGRAVRTTVVDEARARGCACPSSACFLAGGFIFGACADGKGYARIMFIEAVASPCMHTHTQSVVRQLWNAHAQNDAQNDAVHTP